MVPRTFLAPAAGLVFAALAGCSAKGGDYATVSGVITFNNAPVDGAKVVFHSTAEIDGKAARRSAH